MDAAELKRSPYVTRVSDYIDAVKRTGWLPNQFNVLDYANQSARLWGLDVSGCVPLAEGAGEAGRWRACCPGSTARTATPATKPAT